MSEGSPIIPTAYVCLTWLRKRNNSPQNAFSWIFVMSSSKADRAGFICICVLWLIASDILKSDKFQLKHFHRLGYLQHKFPRWCLMRCKLYQSLWVLSGVFFLHLPAYYRETFLIPSHLFFFQVQKLLRAEEMHIWKWKKKYLQWSNCNYYFRCYFRLFHMSYLWGKAILEPNRMLSC